MANCMGDSTRLRGIPRAMPMKKTGRPVASPAMVWALAPAWRTRWKNRMATYAVDPTPDQKSSDPPTSTLALGPDRMSAELVHVRPGPLLAIGLRPVGGGRCFADQHQHHDAHRHHDDRRHLEGQVPGGRIILLPAGRSPSP